MMIHIPQLRIELFFILALVSCFNRSVNKMQPIDIIECANSDFVDINDSDLSMGAEMKAVISSFVGDYQSAVYYATINERGKELSSQFFQEISLPAQVTTYIDSLSDSGQESAKLFEYYLTNPIDSLSEVFNKYQMKDAKEYIVSKAKNYHFLLINEAHYCGQHRAFTKELLEPLWHLGYRYLALEGLRNDAIDGKINYIDNNKIEAGLVCKTEDYLYTTQTMVQVKKENGIP